MNVEQSNLLTVILPGIAGSFLTGCVTLFVFGYVNWKREKRKKGIELLEKFLTSEQMLKARLIAQAYLVPGIDRNKFSRYYGKDFDHINETLEGGTEQEKEDRISIRAIPSFFLVG